MTERARGTRRNRGLVLMVIGVAFLLATMALTMGEVTTTIAQVVRVLFIVGMAMLVAGVGFYLSARSWPS